MLTHKTGRRLDISGHNKNDPDKGGEKSGWFQETRGTRTALSETNEELFLDRTMFNAGRYSGNEQKQWKDISQMVEERQICEKYFNEKTRRY